MSSPEFWGGPVTGRVSRRAGAAGWRSRPVAICRLKRVAADHKGDIRARLPRAPEQRNGNRIALIGAGPASLTVARDLAPLGYELVLFDAEPRGGGMIRSQIPRFRLPEEIIDEEVGYILDLGIETRFGERVESLRGLLNEGYDAIFVGSGAPRGRDLDIPGPARGGGQYSYRHRLAASVSFGHVDRIGRAGDRARRRQHGDGLLPLRPPARRRGCEGDRSLGFDEMKASPWEKEDAIAEGIPILNYLAPKAFTHEKRQLTGVLFEPMTRRARKRRQAAARALRRARRASRLR